MSVLVFHIHILYKLPLMVFNIDLRHDQLQSTHQKCLTYWACLTHNCCILQLGDSNARLQRWSWDFGSQKMNLQRRNWDTRDSRMSRDKPVSVFHWLRDVTAMENYIWTALINKPKFFKLSDTRDLRSNLACLDFHIPLYGFEARAFEALLWTWPWHLTSKEDI